MQLTQQERYHDFYSDWAELRQLFRFDVRYRCRRIQTLLAEHDIDCEGKRVLDVGFGTGALLATFPKSCQITGADISSSAVEKAEHDPKLQSYASTRFVTVDEDDPTDLPEGPFDIVISSHTLEHVRDDRLALLTMRERLAPGGHLVLFVPLEEPDYIPFHLRNYSLQSIVERVRQARFEIEHVEPSMSVNGHVWKVLTIPSRRQWPVMDKVVDALRLTSLSAVPLPLLSKLDRLLFGLGVGPRQALVLARPGR
ncbi:MAG: hypothetical protein CSA65_06485 [Proteobacteria bacterium]|nr:MAG: hypothetical protein CSB49_02480 [Pseudomonadota bacterium]PIE18074.1 MAG: hypothetical protein CSA65_06485 [Pseudomonadota bacterium]